MISGGLWGLGGLVGRRLGEWVSGRDEANRRSEGGFEGNGKASGEFWYFLLHFVAASLVRWVLCPSSCPFSPRPCAARTHLVH